jgi:hypothetical protein
MQKEVGHKHEVGTTKWKVLVVEHLAKVVMYDQNFQNQGDTSTLPTLTLIIYF